MQAEHMLVNEQTRQFWIEHPIHVVLLYNVVFAGHIHVLFSIKKVLSGHPQVIFYCNKIKLFKH